MKEIHGNRIASNLEMRHISYLTRFPKLSEASNSSLVWKRTYDSIVYAQKGNPKRSQGLQLLHQIIKVGDRKLGPLETNKRTCLSYLQGLKERIVVPFRSSNQNIATAVQKPRMSYQAELLCRLLNHGFNLTEARTPRVYRHRRTTGHSWG